MNENDFNGPGFEYLRSYQNMNNLYYKLLALNYQRDFCSRYKCRTIHKYYFSLPNDNSSEQQFIYICLCAWLIKDICQMNLEIQPEEYDDPDDTIAVIIEAIRLLLMNDDDNNNISAKNFINFPIGRLKTGYGPEVIWTLNILADRGLELMFEYEERMLENNENKRIQIVYHSRNPVHDNNNVNSSINTSNNNFITIGQPFVGGGLTTRPLGSYQIDDKSLLLDAPEDDDNVEQNSSEFKSKIINSIEPDVWYQQVKKAEKVLDSSSTNYYCDKETIQMKTFGNLDDNNWPSLLKTFSKCKKSLQNFSNQSQSILEAITARINRHLQVINNRENFIQKNLKSELNEFLDIWRLYSTELNHNNELMEQVTKKTDTFESYTDKMKLYELQIESRNQELNDGSKLCQLETMINRLNEENVDFDLKIGLLLILYSKVHKKIINS